MRSLTCAVAVAGAICGTYGDGYAQGEPPISLTPMTVNGQFLGKKKNERATDVSGMACVPSNSAKQTCLVINDENKNAQFVTLEGSVLTVGQTIQLIRKDDPKTVGAEPGGTCKNGNDGFGEMDGEGVAYAEPYFYVVGSHGCGRKKGVFRTSSFIFARIHVDKQGQPGAVEATYRVSDLLRRAGAAKQYFLKDLETENGLNIEGLAADGDRIWFGLRGPVGADGKAYLVGASANDLFAGGNAPSKAEPTVLPIGLKGLGIRDLAMLPDKRILVLAGAPRGAEKPFELFVVDPDKAGKPDASDKLVQPIRPLRSVTGMVDGKMKTGKAEGLVVDVRENKTQIVILFDDLVDGAPHVGQIVVPPK